MKHHIYSSHANPSFWSYLPDIIRSNYSEVDVATVCKYAYCTEEDLYSVEDNEAYGIKHLAWLLANPECRDVLADSGYDLVEVVSEDGDVFLGIGGDRIMDVTNEVVDILESM